MSEVLPLDRLPFEGRRITRNDIDDTSPTITQAADGEYHVVWVANNNLFYRRTIGKNFVRRVQPTQITQDGTNLAPYANPHLTTKREANLEADVLTNQIMLAYEKDSNIYLVESLSSALADVQGTVQPTERNLNLGLVKRIAIGHEPSVVSSWTEQAFTYVFYVRQDEVLGWEIFYKSSEDDYDVESNVGLHNITGFEGDKEKSRPRVTRLKNQKHLLTFEQINNDGSRNVYMLVSRRQFRQLNTIDDTIILLDSKELDATFTS